MLVTLLEHVLQRGLDSGFHVVGFTTVKKSSRDSSAKSGTCPSISAATPWGRLLSSGRREHCQGRAQGHMERTPFPMARMLPHRGPHRSLLTLGEVRLQVLPGLIQDIGHLHGHGQDVVSSRPKQVAVFQKPLCTLVAHKIWEAEKSQAFRGGPQLSPIPPGMRSPLSAPTQTQSGSARAPP